MRQNVKPGSGEHPHVCVLFPGRRRRVLERDGSKCVSCCCEDVSHVSHAESFYLGQEELLKPCSGL